MTQRNILSTDTKLKEEPQKKLKSHSEEEKAF